MVFQGRACDRSAVDSGQPLVGFVCAGAVISWRSGLVLGVSSRQNAGEKFAPVQFCSQSVSIAAARQGRHAQLELRIPTLSRDELNLFRSTARTPDLILLQTHQNRNKESTGLQKGTTSLILKVPKVPFSFLCSLGFGLFESHPPEDTSFKLISTFIDFKGKKTFTFLHEPTTFRVVN